MRVYVRARTEGEYLDWCSLHRVHPRAAVRIAPGEKPVLHPGDVVVDLDYAITSASVPPSGLEARAR